MFFLSTVEKFLKENLIKVIAFFIYWIFKGFYVIFIPDIVNNLPVYREKCDYL